MTAFPVVSIENLGSIRRAELELRPLTLFLGPNGVNKTWAAYAIYGAARYAAYGPANTVFMDPGTLPSCPELEAHGRRIIGAIERTESGLPLDPRAFTPLEGLVPPDGWSVRLAAEELSDLIGAPLDVFSRATVEARFSADAIRSRELYLGRNLFVARTPTMNVGSERGTVGFGDLRDVEPTVLSHIIRFGTAYYGDVVALPAERKALLLLLPLLTTGNAEALAVAARQVDPHASVESQLLLLAPLLAATAVRRQLARPLRDFLERIREAREWGVGPASDAHHLVGRVYGGETRIERSSPGMAGGRFRYRDERGGDMELASVSSLFRSLASLEIVLSAHGRPGDLLLIDEPEMNAHPAAQLAIAELLVSLVNRGFRVVTTTHSPYIVDHLQNLIAAGRLPGPKQDELAAETVLGDRTAFLDSDLVAAYGFGRDGAVTDLVDRDRGRLDWSTFGDVTDSLATFAERVAALESA